MSHQNHVSGAEGIGGNNRVEELPVNARSSLPGRSEVGISRTDSGFCSE